MLLLVAVQVEIRVRDAIKGYGVSATVEVDGRKYNADNGRLRIDLDGGKHRIKAYAEGYFPIEGEITVRRGGPPAYEFFLQPRQVSPPPEGKKGYAVWYGWVVDSLTLKPVAGVNVEAKVKWGIFKTVTDTSGYYTLTIPIPEEKDVPLNVTVRFYREGYGDVVKEIAPLMEGVYRLNVDVPPAGK